MGAKKKAKPYTKQFASQGESVFDGARDWAAGNTRIVVGAGVAIALAAILLSGGWFFEHSKAVRARAEYAPIASRLPGDSYSDAAEWNKVMPQLEKFISKYGESDSTLGARIDLARGYFATRSYDLAAKTLEEALKVAPRGSSLKPLILYQLAYARQSAGKSDEAAETWTALKKLDAPALAREVSWNLGLLFEKKKNFSEAAVMFELAYQAPGDYPSNPQIDSRLSVIKSSKTK